MIKTTSLGQWILMGVLLCVLAGCARQVTLHEHLTEEDSNEVLSALLEAGIPATKKSGKAGVSISVPGSMSTTALKLLSEKGLPRGKKTSLGEVFKKENLISSPLEERARYLYALSQEIEQTLLGMDGVLTARVHIVLPERTSPSEALAPSSAAVFVKHRADSSFPLYVPQVRQMVFKSIPGLRGNERTSVSVVAVPASEAELRGPALTWLGPIAFDEGAGVLVFSTVALIVLLWGGSVLMVYMRHANPDVWPEWLVVLRGRFKK